MLNNVVHTYLFGKNTLLTKKMVENMFLAFAAKVDSVFERLVEDLRSKSTEKLNKLRRVSEICLVPVTRPNWFDSRRNPGIDSADIKISLLDTFIKRYH